MLSYPLILHDIEEFSTWCSKCVIKCFKILENNYLLCFLINILFPLKLGSVRGVAGRGIVEVSLVPISSFIPRRNSGNHSCVQLCYTQAFLMVLLSGIINKRFY